MTDLLTAEEQRRALRALGVRRPGPQKKPRVVKLTSEHKEQTLLFQWAMRNYVAYPALESLFAIPNYARISPRWGKYMKDEGKRAGVPDVVLPVARGEFSALYIEMKVKPNSVSPEQTMWHQRLRDNGNKVAVCWSWEEARDCILQYLNTTN